MNRLRYLALPLALAAGAVTAPAALAQEPADPCPSVILGTDAVGDAKLYNAVPASPNSDIEKVSIRTADRKTAVTFHIPNLDKTVPPTSTGLGWYFEYTLNGAALFVAATLNPDGTVTYEQGTDGQTYTPTGQTTGSFVTGKDGRITLTIPGLTSATKRYELTVTRAAAYQAVGANIPGVGSAAFLPGADTVTTDEHTTTPCTTAAPAPAASPRKASRAAKRRAARR